jgi:diguanylate cyclase (GGDEF)-like protein
MKDMNVGSNRDITLSSGALGRLMPMHMILDSKGNITGCGPTLLRVLADCDLTSRKFFDLFSVRRPTGVTTVRKLSTLRGERVQLDLKGKTHTFSMRGLCQDLSDSNSYLMNLSFGIGVVDAVRHLQLTESDFAPTDLAIEMLYLVEAKSAVMRELRDLNLRLQGAKQEAEQQALTDILTGLRNRRALETEMVRLIKHARPFAMMHMDLDYFKQVNDTLGHAAGDHVLRHVAEILAQETRASDTIARVGGDEFVMIFQAIDDDDLLMSIAGRIIGALNVPIAFEDQVCRISGSIGITKSTLYSVPDIEAMHADADTALYHSKRTGRGRATVYQIELPAMSAG